jgi:plasmid rolling circle replication initiator protein Rep
MDLLVRMVNQEEMVNQDLQDQLLLKELTSSLDTVKQLWFLTAHSE